MKEISRSRMKIDLGLRERKLQKITKLEREAENEASKVKSDKEEEYLNSYIEWCETRKGELRDEWIGIKRLLDIGIVKLIIRED